jgi:hypothetical protein
MIYKGRKHDYWQKVLSFLPLNKPTAHQASDEAAWRAVEAYHVRPYVTHTHGLGTGEMIGAESPGYIALNVSSFLGQEKNENRLDIFTMYW